MPHVQSLERDLLEPLVLQLTFTVLLFCISYIICHTQNGASGKLQLGIFIILRSIQWWLATATSILIFLAIKLLV